MVNLIKNFKLILGKKNYSSVRKYFIRYYSLSIRAKLKKFEGNLNGKNKTFQIKFLNEDDFPDVKNFFKNNLTKKDKSFLNRFSRKEYFKNDSIRLGVFDNNRLIASVVIYVRGYRNFEFGIAVSKRYRSIGITSAAFKMFIDFCKSERGKHFVRIHKKNDISKNFFKKRGYKTYKSEKNLIYMRNDL